MLFKALSCFALRGIDLTKIERQVPPLLCRSSTACAVTMLRVYDAAALRSRTLCSRPMRSNPISVVDPADADSGSGRVLRFGYLFYVDLAASTADLNTQNALRHLQA
jgi:prephenate dehydratase